MMAIVILGRSVFEVKLFCCIRFAHFSDFLMRQQSRICRDGDATAAMNIVTVAILPHFALFGHDWLDASSINLVTSSPEQVDRERATFSNRYWDRSSPNGGYR